MSPNWPLWHGTGCYQVEREIGGQGEAGRQSQVLSCLLTGPSGMALDVTRLRERLVGRGKLGDNLKCYHVS